MNWHQYFINLATVASTRSKDPNTAVGCVIADSANRVISTGYNGFPAGVKEHTWHSQDKHKFVIHAELNGILYAHRPLQGCKIYTTLFPCSQCAKAIVAAGITEIYYSSDSKAGSEDNTASKEFLNHCNIKLTQVL